LAGQPVGPAGAEFPVLYKEKVRPGFRGSMCGMLLPPGPPVSQMAVRISPENGAGERFMQVLLIRVQPRGTEAYAQALWSYDEELLTVELYGGEALQSNDDYARAMTAMRLARLGVNSTPLPRGMGSSVTMAIASAGQRSAADWAPGYAMVCSRAIVTAEASRH
jgi:hypothetical protein